MATAVETQASSTHVPKMPRTLKWRKKLFGSNSSASGSGSKDVSEDSGAAGTLGGGLKHDIVQGAKGGPPVKGGEPAPGVEERNPIQNVAGTGIVVNDPTDASANHDSRQEERLTDAAGLSPPLSLSPRQQEKRKGGGEDRDEDEDDSEDPTAGLGGLSSGTRRSSVAPGTAEGDEDSDNVQDEEKIVFYHRDKPYFWLSNASDHAVFYDSQRYPTAEHLFQALKFLPHRQDLATKVRKASSPSDAMREARKNATSVAKGWIGQRNNVNAMRTVLLLKFTQHSALQRQLLKTGDAELIEDSPTDAFWGIASGSSTGGIGAGRNELGKALVRTRENIRNQVGLGFGSAAKTV